MAAGCRLDSLGQVGRGGGVGRVGGPVPGVVLGGGWSKRQWGRESPGGRVFVQALCGQVQVCCHVPL